MIWEEMSYNKYKDLSMAQRLKNEYEPDFIYELYTFTIITEEEINESVQTNLFIFD